MIWIIGSVGMLSTELVELCHKQGVNCVASDREVSILDPEALQGFLASLVERRQKSWTGLSTVPPILPLIRLKTSPNATLRSMR